MLLNRRFVLSTACSAGMVAALPRSGVAAVPPSPGAEMRHAVMAWLALLDETQTAAARFAFDSPRRRAWNFMLGSRAAPGLALEQMTPAQKQAARSILATGTSARGFEKAQNVMLLQDILRDEWAKGSPDRNSERFSLQIYGTPGPTEPWAWRWEGHHLSLTFTLLGDEVVSTTPSAFSAEPNHVPSGPHRGLVVLTEEATLAHRLFADLRGPARRAALLSDRAPGRLLSTFGAEHTVAAQPDGLPLGEMRTPQADMARRLIEVFAAKPLPGALAAAQQARLEACDAMRFGWAGTDPDGAVYYRFSGCDLLIEFASLRNQPLHLNAVFHDVRRNFGDHRV